MEEEEWMPGKDIRAEIRKDQRISAPSLLYPRDMRQTGGRPLNLHWMEISFISGVAGWTSIAHPPGSQVSVSKSKGSVGLPALPAKFITKGVRGTNDYDLVKNLLFSTKFEITSLKINMELVSCVAQCPIIFISLGSINFSFQIYRQHSYG